MKSTIKMFSYINAWGTTFDLCVKMVKGQPGVIIWTNLVVLECPMLYTKFELIIINIIFHLSIYKMSRDKTNKMSVRPAKTQISLDILPVWSESSLSAWRNTGSLATHERTAKTGRMPWLIWVFAGRTLTLLVLTCRGSDNSCKAYIM